jgi:hypothetical protein
MHFLRPAVFVLFWLFASQAMAWGSHSAISYRAFEKMPEVANAAAVTVEPLESFLRAEENTIEALLASQEAWARSNIDKYPARPAALAFSADPSRSDDARRIAFLMALRVAPNSKFALFWQPDPWSVAQGTPLPHSAVNTLPETPGASATYLALKQGDGVSALTVLASATDEPDLGLDINLWDDSPSDWGRQYGFGTQPFGNPALSYSSQAPFHMAYLHENRLLYAAAPFIKRTFPLLRSHQFSSLSALAFRTGHAYWGWRFAGLSLHYLQDLSQPYHVTLAPGESTLKLLTANALAMAGATGMKDELLILLSNRHLVLEKYLAETLQRSAATKLETPFEKSLHNADKDRNYPEWNDRYLRDVVSAQANQMASSVVPNLLAVMPSAYVNDKSLDFGSREAGINLLSELGKKDSPERQRLDALLVELMGNFGSHSRNALRGILRASTPP